MTPEELATIRSDLEHASGYIDSPDATYNPHALKAMRCAEQLLDENERLKAELGIAEDLVAAGITKRDKLRAELRKLRAELAAANAQLANALNIPAPNLAAASSSLADDLSEDLHSASRCGQAGKPCPGCVIEDLREAHVEQLTEIERLKSELDTAQAVARSNKRHTEAMAQEVERLNAEVVRNHDNCAAELTAIHEREEWESLQAQLAEAKRERDTARADYERLKGVAARRQEQIDGLGQIHIWTNEDGKRFCFVDDIADALGWTWLKDSTLPSQAVVSEAVAHAVNVGTQRAAQESVIEAAKEWRRLFAMGIPDRDNPEEESLAEAVDALIAAESTADGPEQTDGAVQR